MTNLANGAKRLIFRFFSFYTWSGIWHKNLIAIMLEGENCGWLCDRKHWEEYFSSAAGHLWCPTSCKRDHSACEAGCHPSCCWGACFILNMQASHLAARWRSGNIYIATLTLQDVRSGMYTVARWWKGNEVRQRRAQGITCRRRAQPITLFLAKTWCSLRFFRCSVSSRYCVMSVQHDNRKDQNGTLDRGLDTKHGVFVIWGR